MPSASTKSLAGGAPASQVTGKPRVKGKPKAERSKSEGSKAGGSKIMDLTTTYFPGVMASFTVAAAANFLSKEYGAPPMLMALLLGLAFHFMYQDTKASAGVDFTAKQILRIGVALLGLRITTEALAGLGVLPLVMVVASVVATILVGAFLARSLGLSAKFGFLTGGAVAICGASAALALSSVLPRTKQQEQELERDTLVAVIGVTALSTLAMVSYPLITTALGYTDQETGFFFGATIHDVAQVVGAGYGVSMEAGDTATITKLLRVTLLLPAALAFLLIGRIVARHGAEARGTSGTTLIPMFLVAFMILMALNSLGFVPKTVSNAATYTSQFFLVASIAAIGMKTSLKAMFDLGPRPMLLMVLQTAFIGVLVLVTITFGDVFMSHMESLANAVSLELIPPPTTTLPDLP